MEEETLTTKDHQVKEMYQKSQKWISTLLFTKDELSFIEKFLTSYVFEPNTPNLFERLQDYLTSLQKTKLQLAELDESIHEHERELAGILLSGSMPKHLGITQKHREMASRLDEIQGKFRMLKSEIFNYAGGILKRRRK